MLPKINKKLKVKFKEWNCNLEAFYVGEQPHIILNDVEDGFPVVTATITVNHVNLEKAETIIKDYSGGEGILEVLLKHNVISEPKRYEKISEFVVSPIVEIKDKKEWMELTDK